MSATIKIVIAVCVVIIVILLIISGSTIFCFVIKPRMQRNAERRRQVANARDVEAGESANLIAHQAPKAAKTKPKATEAKSKEAKSVDAPTTTVTIHKTEDDEMKKEPSVQKPASSFEPAPKPAETKAPQEDRTQDSPTGSEGTPPTDQKTAPLMKQSSIFKPNHYIPRAQASVPYKKKKKQDSLDQVITFSETVLASLQRLQRVSPTVQMIVAGGWKLNVDHIMSKLEKNILREHVDVATDSLETLIRQLDTGLLAHGAQYGSNNTNQVTWE